MVRAPTTVSAATIQKSIVSVCTPLAQTSMLLPGLHPLAVAFDNVGLVGVDGISAWAATHHVLDGWDVPRLEEVAATPAVEVVHLGVAAGADEVVPSSTAVD